MTLRFELGRAKFSAGSARPCSMSLLPCKTNNQLVIKGYELCRNPGGFIVAFFFLRSRSRDAETIDSSFVT